MADFEAEYGYPLGVPVNWSAYEDIAEFFTGRDLSHMGHEGEVYGNMDYGKKRSIARLALHRCVDVDGWHGRRWRAERLPVDEWGIRVNENSQPVGSCVARGGATNGPAAAVMPSKSTPIG
jgi:glycerol transport system substrate-binding protein